MRVVDLPGYSKEICGGTHVARSVEVRPFRLVSEKSVAAGTRRVEAVSGAACVEWLDAERRSISRLASSSAASGGASGGGAAGGAGGGGGGAGGGGGGGRRPVVDELVASALAVSRWSRGQLQVCEVLLGVFGGRAHPY